MSLRARVLAGLMLIAVVLTVAAFLITRTTEAHLIAEVDAQLIETRQPIGGLELRGPPPDTFEDTTDGETRPERLSSFYVGVFGSDGVQQTLFAPNASGETPPLPEIDFDQAAAAADSGEPFTVGSAGPRYRVRAQYEEHFGVHFVIALPLDGVDSTVDRLVMVELAATSAVLAVLGLVAWWVVHLGVRPIKEMTATATAIAAGDLSHRVAEGDPRTEAGELGAALNRMLGHIEEAFDERTRSENRLRQFVADASHELRTPVATVRGYAELFRSGGLDDARELAEAMRRTEQEALRMGSLVDDLLHLARLDQGRPLERRPVDLAAVIDDAVRDARAVDPERPITARADGPLVVTGDEGRLRQVLANLLGNALVHTPDGTPIEVVLSRSDGAAVVEVIDHGPGMPAEVAARAFERFYRADPSRSRHRGGSGLGLSIVEATVAAHRGRVELDSAPGRGTTVRIELPFDGLAGPGVGDT